MGRQVERSSMIKIQREKGGWGGVEQQRGTPFLKSNRISLAYVLTSNKDQSFRNESCLFSCYIEKYVDFVPFSGALGGGGMAALGLLGCSFEGHGSPVPTPG